MNIADALARGEVLKRHDASRVVRTVIDGRPAILKTFFATPRTRLQALTRTTRAHRQARGATILQEAGFDASVVRAIETDDEGTHLVLDDVPGPTLLEVIARGDADAALARRVGALVGDLTSKGLFNRDHKPSNIVVGDRTLTLIDTVAIRRARRPARMLASLWIEPLGVGATVPASLALRAVIEASRRARMAPPVLLEQIAALVSAHGDPTPTDDPLLSSRKDVPWPSPLRRNE